MHAQRLVYIIDIDIDIYIHIYILCRRDRGIKGVRRLYSDTIYNQLCECFPVQNYLLCFFSFTIDNFGGPATGKTYGRKGSEKSEAGRKERKH